jgi:hypothetical protein
MQLIINGHSLHHNLSHHQCKIRKDPPNIEHWKVLLKKYFFFIFLKNESNFPVLWDLIDTAKLVYAIPNVVAQLQQKI